MFKILISFNLICLISSVSKNITNQNPSSQEIMNNLMQIEQKMQLILKEKLQINELEENMKYLINYQNSDSYFFKQELLIKNKLQTIKILYNHYLYLIVEVSSKFQWIPNYYHLKDWNNDFQKIIKVIMDFNSFLLNELGNLESFLREIKEVNYLIKNLTKKLIVVDEETKKLKLIEQRINQWNKLWLLSNKEIYENKITRFQIWIKLFEETKRFFYQNLRIKNQKLFLRALNRRYFQLFNLKYPLKISINLPVNDEIRAEESNEYRFNKLEKKLNEKKIVLPKCAQIIKFKKPRLMLFPRNLFYKKINILSTIYENKREEEYFTSYFN